MRERGLAPARRAQSLNVGAFPTRRPFLAREDPRRQLPIDHPQSREIRFQGNRNVAATVFSWAIPDQPGTADDAKLDLLAEILDTRLNTRVREQLGLTYSPRVDVLAIREGEPRWRILEGFVETAPRKLKVARTETHEVVARLTREGATSEELQRAKFPLLRQASSDRKNNAWWIQKLARAQSDPGGTDGFADYPSALEKCSLEELNALARDILRWERAYEISARPR